MCVSVRECACLYDCACMHIKKRCIRQVSGKCFMQMSPKDTQENSFNLANAAVGSGSGERGRKSSPRVRVVDLSRSEARKSLSPTVSAILLSKGGKSSQSSKKTKGGKKLTPSPILHQRPTSGGRTPLVALFPAEAIGYGVENALSSCQQYASTCRSNSPSSVEDSFQSCTTTDTGNKSAKSSEKKSFLHANSHEPSSQAFRSPILTSSLNLSSTPSSHGVNAENLLQSGNSSTQTSLNITRELSFHTASPGSVLNSSFNLNTCVCGEIPCACRGRNSVSPNAALFQRGTSRNCGNTHVPSRRLSTDTGARSFVATARGSSNESNILEKCNQTGSQTARTDRSPLLSDALHKAQKATSLAARIYSPSVHANSVDVDTAKSADRWANPVPLNGRDKSAKCNQRPSKLSLSTTKDSSGNSRSATINTPSRTANPFAQQLLQRSVEDTKIYQSIRRRTPRYAE